MLYILIYIFNILLLLLYSVALATVKTLFFIEKNKERRQLLFFLIIYFISWIFDSIILSMTENLTSFDQYFTSIFGGSPLSKTLVYFINNFCMINILALLLKQKVAKKHYFLLSFITIWMLLTPFFPSTAWIVFLFYLPSQLFLFYLGYVLYRSIQQKLISEPYIKVSKIVAYLYMIFGALIALEDGLVVFFFDKYNLINLVIIYRNYSECVFSVVMAILVIYYAIHFYKTNYESALDLAVDNPPINRFKNFCIEYNLTDREEEILTLLLNKETNQEIADELFLSIGTVKTHIHNIYTKTNVSKRKELFEIYEEYH